MNYYIQHVIANQTHALRMLENYNFTPEFFISQEEDLRELKVSVVTIFVFIQMKIFKII